MIILLIYTKNKIKIKKGNQVAPDWSGSLFIKKDVLVILLSFSPRMMAAWIIMPECYPTTDVTSLPWVQDFL